MANPGCVTAIARCLRGTAVFLPLLLAGLGHTSLAATVTGSPQASAEPVQKLDSALAEPLPYFVIDAIPQKAVLQNLAAGAARQRGDEREKPLAVRQSQQHNPGNRPDQGVEQQTGAPESGGVQDIVVAIMFGLAALILVTRRRITSPTPDS
ncbi:MAG: hypothetical protein JJU08_05830 [Rhodobacteraceae bacterium]|nr:hypothetical protein [Paracoccaceae bacterium]